VITLWDGSSPGTKRVIEYAKKTKKPVEVILYGEKTIGRVIK